MAKITGNTGSSTFYCFSSASDSLPSRSLLVIKLILYFFFPFSASALTSTLKFLHSSPRNNVVLIFQVTEAMYYSIFPSCVKVISTSVKDNWFIWLLTAHHFPELFSVPTEQNVLSVFLKNHNRSVIKYLMVYGVTTIFPSFDFISTVNHQQMVIQRNHVATFSNDGVNNHITI